MDGLSCPTISGSPENTEDHIRQQDKNDTNLVTILVFLAFVNSSLHFINAPNSLQLHYKI